MQDSQTIADKLNELKILNGTIAADFIFEEISYEILLGSLKKYQLL